MSDPRKIYRPRSDIAKRPLPCSRLPSVSCYRVHGKGYPAIGFRVNPAHRFSHPDAQQGLLYLGMAIPTCLWECFGDDILGGSSKIALARWENSCLSKIEATFPMKICDLTNTRTLASLGLDAGTLMQQDLSITQEWALAIQNHAMEVDGIRYHSRFCSEPCLVLFDRPARAGKLQASMIGKLPVIPDADHFLLAHQIALV